MENKEKINELSEEIIELQNKITNLKVKKQELENLEKTTLVSELGFKDAESMIGVCFKYVSPPEQRYKSVRIVKVHHIGYCSWDAIYVQGENLVLFPNDTVVYNKEVEKAILKEDIGKITQITNEEFERLKNLKISDIINLKIE